MDTDPLTGALPEPTDLVVATEPAPFWKPFGDPTVEGDGWLGWFLPEPGSAPLVDLPDISINTTPIAVAIGLVGLSAVGVFALTRGRS